MKKILSLVLSACMMLSAAALAEGTFTPADSYDVGERVYNAGTVTLEKSEGSAQTVSTDRYVGEAGKDYTDEKVYTYNSYTPGINSSLNWDPLSWETNEDTGILDYVSSSFYTFVLNSEKNGYSVVPELASEMPVDVTAEYVGQYGVKEGETAKAWRIALNKLAKWEDGTPITADDYVYSMQQLLNPKMLNRRADSYYAGEFVIYNAKNYLYAGKTTYDLIADTAENLIAAGTDVYLDMSFWGVVGALDAEGNAAPQYVNIADDTMYRDTAVEDETANEAWVSAKYLFDNYFAAGQQYESMQAQYLYTASVANAATWDEVGFKKVDDYTVDFILANPVNEANFYVPYNLSSSYLVYKPVYEACKTFYKDGKEVATEEEADEVKTSYGRSVENTVSYGPYKLSSFELDKEYTLTRNDNWYGYHDGNHVGQYQTDNYKVTCIADHATQVLAFEKGEIDEIALQADDLKKYGNSKYIKYGPNNGYTTKLTMNTDYEKLLSHGTNSQVLAIPEFRQAISYSYDRKEFASSFTAAGTAGFGLINELYCYDPFTGALYRDSEPAKAVLCRLFDLTWGEGGDYDTLDEAYEAMTGYEVEKARALMAVAYDKAVAAGIYDGTSDIKIDLRVYQSDTIYVNMFNYLNAALKNACVGTPFEGKVEMTMTVDTDYYETMQSGNADMIFTTWGGATMAPFGVFGNCYTDDAYGNGNQNEYGYDTTTIDIVYNVEGVGEVTDTLQNWANWCNSQNVPSIEEKLGKFADYTYDTRLQFATAVEGAFMNWYPCSSIYYRNTASMNSQKVNTVVDSYVTLIGFGGIQYMTYNYDDAEWADYIANNTLEY